MRKDICLCLCECGWYMHSRLHTLSKIKNIFMRQSKIMINSFTVTMPCWTLPPPRCHIISVRAKKSRANCSCGRDSLEWKGRDKREWERKFDLKWNATSVVLVWVSASFVWENRTQQLLQINSKETEALTTNINTYSNFSLLPTLFLSFRSMKYFLSS
jgi:hypothetical protein